MSPEVVSLPTADERKKMEAAGRPAIQQPYGEKVRPRCHNTQACNTCAVAQYAIQAQGCALLMCICCVMMCVPLQCDIWACGVLAYELMVGRPPFEVKEEAETRKRIMYETTLQIPPHVSPDAVNFIKCALAKNASLRPSASHLIHHPWLRPYLMAMAQQATGHLDSSSLRWAGIHDTTNMMLASSSSLHFTDCTWITINLPLRKYVVDCAFMVCATTSALQCVQGCAKPGCKLLYSSRQSYTYPH